MPAMERTGLRSSELRSSSITHDVVSSLWIGELSPLERLCIHSFVRHGHPFHLYVYGNVGSVPPGVTLREAGEILPPSMLFQNNLGGGKGSYAGFSDLFRFKLLLDRGGWWVDTDVYCHRPFRFSAAYVLGAEDKPVATGVIKAPVGSELMQRCFAEALDVDPMSVVWNEYCMILERQVRDLDLLGHVMQAEAFSPIVWHEIPQYVRGEKVYVRRPESYAVHLYNEMWRQNNIDKHGVFPANSIFTILNQEAGTTAC